MALNKDAIASIKIKIQDDLKNKSSEMLELCLKVIDYISIAPELKVDFSLSQIYDSINSISDEDVFYNSIFYLTRKNINILTQKFKVLDANKNEYIPYTIDTEFLRALSERDFYNPITGDELSEKEFSEQVLTYFAPSDGFKEKINAK